MSQAENTPTTTTTTSGGEDRKAARLLMFVIVFIDLLGFGIVLPLLPAYADKYLTPLMGEKNNLSGLVLGLLMSSFSMMQFLFAPAWGRLSDRIGRRPVLLVGLAGSVLAYALFGIASDLSSESAAIALALLFASRAGAGIAGATISTAQAVIADCTPPKNASWAWPSSAPHLVSASPSAPFWASWPYFCSQTVWASQDGWQAH